MAWHNDLAGSLRMATRFTGRSGVRESLPMIVFAVVGFFALNFIWEELSLIYLLVILLPYTSTKWRRLHDLGRTGVWVLLPFAFILAAVALGTISTLRTPDVEFVGLGSLIIGLLGFFLTELIVLGVCLMPGQTEPNRFGPVPLREVP
jgi:uncharacterized membrane protein YhaH (DUF805 family)